MERATNAILDLFKRIPDGIPQHVLSAELPDISNSVLAAAINRLSKEKKLQMVQNAADNSITYKEVEASKSARLKGLVAEELLVYQCIEAAGNTGLWTKDMKHKTNLQQTQVTKILKQLESRNLVKAIKPVNQPSKKFYMLFDLEPAREITGGAWYTDQDYDSEFIEVLQTQCFNFIKQAGEASLEEVSAFIHDKGISKIQLRDEDVMMILETLEFDGRVDRIDNDDGDSFRQAMLAIPQTSAFTSIPCGVCPVFTECTPDGPISPITCIYYQQWLDF
ncbi:hypothetical protein ABBQ38_002920 [Trebouxia sp. C0009 RCD-2024]